MLRICRLALLLGIGLAAGPAFADEAGDHFDKSLAPLLAKRCLDCHSGSEPKGGLDLSTKALAFKGGESGAAIVAGKPDDSLLWQRIADGEMPPKKPLPAAEREVLKTWLASGARWGTDKIDPFRYTTDARAGYDWWSLQPVKRPAVPLVATDWPRTNAIDAFVQAKLSEKELTPSKAADRRTLLRRLSFDLLGLPPTPDELNAFSQDTSPAASDRMVERLLASPHYGERWARHWLDLGRFGESQGFERDKLRTNSWRYRDWVVEAFNRDLPYDEFIRRQIAGDVLDSSRPEDVVATGFLVAGAFDEVGKSQQSAAMKAVVRQDELEDITGAVTQTFLGLTANCARCHDHKFDPIRQKEYYQLTAALAGVEHGQRDVAPQHEELERTAKVAALRARRDSIARGKEARDAEIRAKLLAERKTAPPQTKPPTPLAEWTFDADVRDARGLLHAELKGTAKATDGALSLDGQSAYAATAPLAKDLGEKTLAAWVQLDNLKQRGGAAIGLQSLDGNTFDAIAFAEQEPGRWMAGSDFFRRTQSFGGAEETAAKDKPVFMAIVYAADGTISAYRNGQPYGKPYKSAGLATFKKGEAQVIFGLRHSPAAANKLLAGTIDRAMLFDRALSPDEVAALAGIESNFVGESEIAARLSAAEREARAAQQFELEQLADQIKRWEENKIYAVAPQRPHDVHVLARGEPNRKGEAVAAGGVASLVGLSADFALDRQVSDADRRKKLAQWLSDQRNPLAARVMVNRLWHYHFGVGLVDTPNDFGFNGGRPSHPELLDWLAAELVESGWSLKHVQRLIVTSAAYQQSSLPNEAAQKIDADNRLLWRKSPQRLDAETLRDAILAVSGELNREMAGPGYADFHTFTNNSQFYDVFDPIGHTFNRRSLYRTWIRSGRSNLLDVFDCPDPSTKTPVRAVTTTPLQALSLLNNSFVLRMSEATAARVRRDTDEELGPNIERLYWLALGRSPSWEEAIKTHSFANEYGVPALVRVLFNSNEFVYVD